MKSITGKLGKYQDDVSALSNLDIVDYERIFKVHTASVEDKQFYFYNILNKIVFPVNITDRILGLYTAKSKEPLTTTSFRLYGDIKSWWMIYLLNPKILKTQFFVEGGQQLQYILPEFRSLIYSEITNTTVFDNQHF
tara:strand:- start:188 stop:598 length:411 start_codon:yes stop_codon:yes gene_type:complete